MRILLASLVVAAVLGGAAVAEETPLLRLDKTIPLEGVRGRLDHMALDPEGRILALAALGDDSVQAVDVLAGAVADSLEHLKRPQGIVFVPGRRVAVACAGDGMLRYLDTANYLIVEETAVGEDCDNVRLDAGGALWVGAGNGSLVLVEGGKKAAGIPLQGHPESFQLEAKGVRAFVNVPKAKHVAVVDRKQRKVVATWPLPEGVGDNYPMALDEAKKRLYVGCRTPAQLVVFDTASGKVVANVEISGDVDDVFHDAAAKRLYLSCGAGFVDVVEEGAADAYARVGQVPTRTGARTSLFDKAGSRLFVAVPARDKEPAEIRVYSTKK